MRKKKYLYYLLSFTLVAGIYLGAQNSQKLFPNLVERFNRKEEICLALPKMINSGKIQEALSHKNFQVNFKEYESKQELEVLLFRQLCQVLVFPSKFLPIFFDQSRLTRFSVQDIDLSKVSPDFLGLSFDRLNEYYFPISYWVEKSGTSPEMVKVNLLLAAASSGESHLKIIKEIISKLLSPEVQAILAGDGKMGTVLKDTEISVPLKSSALRQYSLKELTIVKEDK